MLSKKIVRFLKSGFLVISIGFSMGISGCKGNTEEPVSSEPIEIVSEKGMDDNFINIPIDIYAEATTKNKLKDMETVRKVVERFGKCGYAAVDCENRVDMTQMQSVMDFCDSVEKQEKAEVTILQVSSLGGFSVYHLQTEKGVVHVKRCYYGYKDGIMKSEDEGEYQTDYWRYTDDGYLMFSGTYFSEELYVLTLSSAEEHVAFRILPLDAKCRELNEKYLLPIGYELNNMFLVDWNEDDFGDLNFYDMFDLLYPKLHNEKFPYVADDNLGIGAVYHIPKTEFENVIMEYFNIDSETLQSKTVYDSEDSTYEYKPRGFEEVEYPEYPYSEVIGYTENSDGTITLTANVVFPYSGNSKVYAHEVVIRPLEDGRVQYVSNRIIPSEDNSEETWHTPRLTAEEWEELYGGELMEYVNWLLKKWGFPILMLLIAVIAGVLCCGKHHTEEQKAAEEVWEPPVEIKDSETITEEESDTETSIDSAYWLIPQASDCLISDEEKQHLQSTVLSAAESVKEIYKNVIIKDAANYSSGVSEFTSEQRKTVVEQLGAAGLVSVEEDTNMQNPEKIEMFYSDYLNGKDSMVTIFEVQRDGLIGAFTFIYRKGELQTYYIGIRWKEGGIPEIQGTSVSNVTEIKLTEKGYFIYAFEYVIAHASLRQYWRIEPLPEDCRKLTQEYISGLSYVNYNVLVTNWDRSNVEDILMPCMYEDIYRIYTGENLKTENWKIPAEEYERIMTTYFPVSVEQLREHCGYDKDSNSYEYEMIYASPYPPFGEVVDYTENADGTLTLIVDGVWPDYNSDLAFRNTVVVQPFEDGTFRYLSNSIEQIELELPPIAKSQQR